MRSPPAEPASLNVTYGSDNTIVYQNGVDYNQLRYGGVGNGSVPVENTVFVVPGTGCVEEDYAGITDGAIALVPYVPDDCTVYEQALLAQSKMASAVLQYLTSPGALLNSRVRAVNWTEDSEEVTIPTFSISYALGQTLQQAVGATVKLAINSSLYLEYTFNVICDTGGASTDADLIVAGAHLGACACVQEPS